MAKYEASFCADVDAVVTAIHDGILSGSISASLDDGSDFSLGDCRCLVRVYERYSAFGGNRVSLNVTLLARGTDVRLSAITSGGSDAMFFKMNTLGEVTFLEALEQIVAQFPTDQPENVQPTWPTYSPPLSEPGE